MAGDFLEELFGRHERARASRPEVPEGDLLFSVAGEEHAESIAERNAGGRVMVFACLRVAVAARDVVVEDSTRRPCGRCGAEVWMSPATLRTYEKLALREIACLECIGMIRP